MTAYDTIIIVITDIDPTVRGIPFPHKLIILSKLKCINFYNRIGMILMSWSMEQLNLVMQLVPLSIIYFTNWVHT